jgi:predicted negative regulator of RcsB-dependent stress response
MAQQTTKNLDTFDRFQIFFDKNQKVIIGTAFGILIIVAAIFFFRNFYLPNQEKKAQASIFYAQAAFEKDSFQVALDGDGVNPGFLKIAKDYNFTKAANLAHLYAGLSYYYLKNYDEAIKHLKDFDGDDAIVGATAKGALGDAYAQKGDMDKAISSYKDAGSYNDNEFTAPIFMMKAALALEVQGKYKESLDELQLLQSKYPKYEADNRTVDKHIARLEQLAK